MGLAYSLNYFLYNDLDAIALSTMRLFLHLYGLLDTLLRTT